MLTAGDLAEAEGLEALATIRSWASVGVARPHRAWPDRRHPEGLDRAGLTVADVDLFEINEAFASVPVATCKALPGSTRASSTCSGAAAASATRSP